MKDKRLNHNINEVCIILQIMNEIIKHISRNTNNKTGSRGTFIY